MAVIDCQLPGLDDDDKWRRAAATLRSALQTDAGVSPPMAILTLEHTGGGTLQYGLDFHTYEDALPSSDWHLLDRAEARAIDIVGALHPIEPESPVDPLHEFSIEVARTKVPPLSQHERLAELRLLERRLAEAGLDAATRSRLLNANDVSKT